jgi:hypothetical protein
VRREYVTLLHRLGSHEKELVLDALTKAHSRLQLQRDDLAALFRAGRGDVSLGKWKGASSSP